MKKTESLTPEQEKRLVEYRNKWLAIGRSTEPANRPKAEAAITRMYELLGHPQPRFWWSDGPAVGSLVRAILTDKELKKGDSLGASLGANLRDSLMDNLGANLGDSLRDSLWDSLGANLRANLGDSLGDSLMASLRDSLGANLTWNNWGSHEAYWSAYYNFPDTELRTMFSDSDREKLSLWLTLAEETGWWEPYQNVVFMCERPAIQLVNERGQLHCDTGPALLCRDGFPVWALNGVRCKESHVMTPAGKMEATDIMKEENVEIRRELIRKVGVERMLAKLPHRVLNKQGDYELLSVDFPGLVQDARYLKMLNPSIGVWHMEGVERACKTVQEAINWRAGELLPAGESWTPSQLT